MTNPDPPFTASSHRGEPPDPSRSGTDGPTDLGGRFEVTLSGEVDLVAEPELSRLVEAFRRDPCSSAVVDLRAVTFFDTTGLSFLDGLREVALQRGGAVTVVGASGACLRTLTIVGFDTSFDLVA
jgi:anti-anti-sigma factor